MKRRSSTVFVAAAAVMATTGCSGADVQEQARERLRTKVQASLDAVTQALVVHDTSRERLQEAVDQAVSDGAVVADATRAGDSIQVRMLVTAAAGSGGGLNYSFWATRACVVFRGPADGSGELMTSDSACPSGLIPDPGPANEVLKVAS